MKILLLNEYIYGQVSNEDTFWSVLANNLENAESLALSNFTGDLSQYIAEKNPDIVVYNSLLEEVTMPSSVKKIVLLQDNFIAMEKELPYGIIQRIKYFIHGKNSFFKKHIRIQRKNLNEADALVCVSRHIARSYGVKSYVIPIGVDTQLFKPMDKQKMRKKHGIPQDKRVKIFVGSTHLVKGFDILLEEIKKDHQSLYILVLKDNGFIDIDLPNVRVYYKLKQKKLAELYNCADVYVGRSRVETLWLAPLEAMFCGIPVDVTSTGIFADWSPQNINPREEVIEKKLSREHMLSQWESLVQRVFLEK